MNVSVRFRIVTISFCVFFELICYGQVDKCGTSLNRQYLLSQYPQLAAIRKQSQVNIENLPRTFSVEQTIGSIIKIPVVVHVVYNTPAENISDLQIQSQIAVLNKDYRKLNLDTTFIPAPWKSVAADAGIEFFLAQKDPAGNDTNGITRTSTTVTQFNYDNQVKKTSTKGQDPWDPSKYLNLWVCDLGPSLYGFAQFPSDYSTSPLTDGVVLNYTAFGTNGAAKSPSNGGRTATHEIGHWLDLYHIWGDDGGGCTGDDLISDTPNQGSAHYGCTLTYPYTTDPCTPGTPGIMFMNYMDYGDDQCLVMFTKGQAARIMNTLNTIRSSILYTAVAEEQSINSLSLFPNPANGIFTITSSQPLIDITVFNVVGENIYHVSSPQSRVLSVDINRDDRPAGIYFVRILTGLGCYTQKVIVN